MTRIDRTGVLVSCEKCGKTNRLSFAALGKPARCGNCKTPIPPPAVPIEITDSAAFDAAAATSVLPLVVDFWAPWCGPCRMVAPELEKVARAHAGRYLVVKVNTDALQDIAARFRIQSIPTLAVIVDGQEVDRVAGVRPASEIETFVARTVASRTRRAS